MKAKGHLFARWDEGDKSFNIEGTTIGFVSHPDSYYRNWPAPFMPEEQEAESYLKSLTPAQEFAVFLSIRAHCLRASGDFRGVLVALSRALKVEPQSIGYQKLFARGEREALRAGVLPKREALMIESRQLQIPGGPMNSYYTAEKARIQAMLLLGSPENELERDLRVLQAEVSLHQSHDGQASEGIE